MLGLHPGGTGVRLVDTRRAVVVGPGGTRRDRPDVVVVEERPGTCASVVLRTADVAAVGAPAVIAVLHESPSDAERVRALG